jgi:hypothetical protein
MSSSAKYLALAHRMAVGKIAGRRLTPLESLRFVPGRPSRAAREVSRGF